MAKRHTDAATGEYLEERYNSLAFRYGFAILVSLVVIGIRWLLDPVISQHAPYLPFALALMLVSRVTGRGPGIAMTVLCVAAADWLFIEPRHSFAIADVNAETGLILFGVVGILISLLLGDLRESLLDMARSEALLRRQAQLIELSHDAIITADASRVITSWNAGAEDLFGWTNEEAVGRRLQELLQTESGMSTSEIDAVLARDGHWDGELSLTARDGRRLVTESRQSLVRDRRGNISGILEIRRDVTERRRVQEELSRAQQETSRLLESVSDGFNAFDREWRYTYVNPAAARMAQRRPEELLGKVLWDVLPGTRDSVFGRACLRAVAENVPVRTEAFRGHDGARWYRVQCYPSPDGLTVLLTDVTESQLASERLRQTQKLESISILAGGVAHDFNNLLTVIMGSASSALSECPECESARAILGASERAADLTKQLLAYAGKSRSAVKVVELPELVWEWKEALAAAIPKHVELAFSLARDLPRVEIDPNHIEQVLMNLVVNAGEAIPPQPGGRIEIAAYSRDVSTEEAHQRSLEYEVVAGLYVCLEVRDNGTGMEEVTLEHVFDPFFSTKFTGRGLGLAAVHGIVRSAGGFIEVSSSAGGSIFRVLLPAVPAGQPGGPEPAVARSLDRGLSTVLVVDDEDMIRNLACLTLRRSGYEVLEARDGREALKILETAPVLPSVAILDLAMPVMGGDELIPILAQRYPDLKVIISSGFPEDDTRRGFRHGGIAGYLQKPYPVATLLSEVSEALGGETHCHPGG
jgi:two-component system, cell cycle sensor histidine kinase and response regulator CckA